MAEKQNKALKCVGKYWIWNLCMGFTTPKSQPKVSLVTCQHESVAPWQSIIAPPSAIGKVVQVRCWGFAFGWGSLRGITEALKTNHVAISGDPVIWSCFQMQQVLSILFIF